MSLGPLLSYGICHLSVIPLRLEPSDASEMVNQLLFGEHFEILERTKKWSKIRLFFDNYEGFIDNKQYQEITQETYIDLSKERNIYTAEFISFITDNKDISTIISLGSRLPFLQNKRLNINNSFYSYEGKICYDNLNKSAIVEKAFLFLNVPYLWGGKSSFGIDCSGFTQTVYKLCGYNLFRDAKEQATQGQALNSIEESEAGDLAFFDNQEGKIIHVGIILKNHTIIHAHGKVRIDKLNNNGIYDINTNECTHKLSIIKRFFNNVKTK